MKINADSHLNVKQHTFKKNQNVLFKWKPTNKHQTRLDPNPYKITNVKCTMITAKNKFHEVTRNSSCFQSYLGEVDLATAPTLFIKTETLFIINSNFRQQNMKIATILEEAEPISPPETPAIVQKS